MTALNGAPRAAVAAGTAPDQLPPVRRPLAFASVTGQTGLVLSGAAILSLSFQTLFISIISYLVWFWLLRHYLTSRLMLLSLLTPLFGVLFGALLLREPIESRFALGSVLVLTGILIVGSRQVRQTADVI